MEFVDRGHGLEVEPFLRAWQRSRPGERGVGRVGRFGLACRLLLRRAPPARIAPDRRRIA